MILRPSLLRPITCLVSSARIQGSCHQTRHLTKQVASSRIPPPTPFVPDVQTFLSLIGRNLSQHSAKIPSWEALFSLSSTQLKDLGIEPPRARRYLLSWTNKFRKGDYGIYGDVKTVVDGVAEVRVVEVPKTTDVQPAGQPVPTLTPRTRKIVVNLPSDVSPSDLPPEQLTPIKGLKIRGAQTIVGPYIQHVKGENFAVARITTQEGLWEHKRGRKIDGGERRQAEVRAKRRSAEKNAR